MGNSIGTVMDDLSGKVHTFFILVLLKMMKYDFFFIDH